MARRIDEHRDDDLQPRSSATSASVLNVSPPETFKFGL